MTYDEVSASVLYEDNHLLVINKPSGVLSQGDSSKARHVIDFVKYYIKIKYNRPGDVYVHPVHRLDRVVSGCLILSRTSKATQRFNKFFKNKQLSKKYLAIVQGGVQDTSRRLHHYLYKDTLRNKVKVTDNPTPKAKECILEYKTLAIQQGFSLLEVTLITGRSHQIRAQLSHIGHPIVGDAKYKSDFPNRERTIMLHAVEIIFQHPTKKEDVKICSLPVMNKSWKKFESNIKELKYC